MSTAPTCLYAFVCPFCDATNVVDEHDMRVLVSKCALLYNASGHWAIVTELQCGVCRLSVIATVQDVCSGMFFPCDNPHIFAHRVDEVRARQKELRAPATITCPVCNATIQGVHDKLFDVHASRWRLFMHNSGYIELVHAVHCSTCAALFYIEIASVLLDVLAEP